MTAKAAEREITGTVSQMSRAATGLASAAKSATEKRMNAVWSPFATPPTSCTLMTQAALIDGVLFDLPSSVDDGLAPTVEDIGGSEVAQAFVATAVIVALGEGADTGFKIAR